MVTCDSCGYAYPDHELHYCRGCGCQLCEECWEDGAYRSYDLCWFCGYQAAQDDYWEQKLLQEEEGCH